MKTIDQFKASMAALRKNGFITRTNVSSCCRGCAEVITPARQEQFDNGAPVLWTYKGQGTETGATLDAWNTVYVYHENVTDELFSEVVDAFTPQFTVKWDGEQHSAIEVERDPFFGL